MKIFKNVKSTIGLTGAFAIVFLLIGRSAEACPVCVVTNSYNAFRFTIIWYYFFFIWLIATLIAGVTVSRTGEQKVSGLVFARSSLKMLLAAVILVLLGLNLVVVLYFPFILLRYCFPNRFASKKHSYIRELAPKWLRTTSRVLLAAMVLSILPSYFVLPMMLNEPNTRAMRRRARENLKSLTSIVNDCRDQLGSYPLMLQVEHNGKIYTTLDPQELLKVRATQNEHEIADLLEDPFGFQLRTFPLPPVLYVCGLPATYPFIERAPGMFMRIQYYHSPTSFVLWGRGPDAEFSPHFIDAFTSDGLVGQAPGPAMFTTVTYDPTNGTMSPGDIFCVGQRPELRRMF